MSTTVSMWLGIAFLGLVIAAVLLQAWLWGPKFWNEEKKKTEAPRLWLRVHALCGYTYGIIYVVMMWNMLPRLWEYQYELPARTVFHAVVAIAIGVLLICKILILLFFRHFEESMPYYGFGLLLCTVVLIVLSVPYALRAQDLLGKSMSPENVERVDKLLADVEFEGEVDRAALTSKEGLTRGKDVLVNKCVVCHDMRVILAKPRTAQKWFDVNRRMLEKPSIFRQPLDAEDVPFVTAYLVAITPDIQKSVKQKRKGELAEKARRDATAEAMHEADEREAPKVDEATGEALLQAHCTECHGLEEVDEHGPDDLAGWRSVVAAMIEEGAEYTEEQGAQIAAYLAQKYPAKEEAAPAVIAEPEPEPEPEPAPETKEETKEETKAEPDAKATPKPKKPKKPKPKKPEGEAKPKPKKPKPKGSASAGRPVYLAKCKGCHGADGKGQTAYGKKLGLPSIAKTSLSRKRIKSIIENGVPGTKMKPLPQQAHPRGDRQRHRVREGAALALVLGGVQVAAARLRVDPCELDRGRVVQFPGELEDPRGRLVIGGRLLEARRVGGEHAQIDAARLAVVPGVPARRLRAAGLRPAVPHQGIVTR